ncbi:MAG: hypothetical protein NVSMB19_04550 [Vulcanimicrobiaceae bacterium]
MGTVRDPAPASSNTVPLLLSWTFVGIPLLWGVSLTLINAAKLFK